MKVKIDNNWHDVNYVDYINVDGQHQKGRPYDIQDIKIGKRQLFGGYNKWVSVQTRYPEDMRNVLILTDGGRIFTAYYLDDAEVWQSPYEDDKEYKHVTHWHELPKLPKTK
jgi:hypothetical protein